MLAIKSQMSDVLSVAKAPCQVIATIKTCSVVSAIFFALSLANVGYAENRNEVIFFFNDALGSAVAAVSENGDLCWSEHYTPYGDKTINDDLVNIPGCGIVGEERGYGGHTEDVNSDLVYMQQRYYDPSIGRFLSIDPQDAVPGDPKTYNRYAYANNNPYKYTDPDGEFAFLVPLGMMVAREIVTEMASRATNGATDFLSVRKQSVKAFKGAAGAIHRVFKKGCSFEENMQVLTSDGYLTVANIEPGVHKVWTRDELFNQMQLQPVLEALYADYEQTVYLRVIEEKTGITQTLVTNRVHPFFAQRFFQELNRTTPVVSAYNSSQYSIPAYRGSIDNGNWLEASELLVGDRLLGADSSWLKIISVEQVDEPLTAYNIDVANNDNFFVRGTGSTQAKAVWVHNCDVPNKPALPDSAWHKNAPHQAEPGTKSITHQKYNPKTKQLEKSTVEYDQYGRQVKRTDHTDHGYGDVSKPNEYHSNPHTHTYEYGPGYGPKGKETRINH